MPGDYPTGPIASHRTATGLILAGGRGRRMGNVDKGLVNWEGRPLVEHVIERFKPQVGRLLVSCNRNASTYRRYTNDVIGDRLPDYQGPLAGIASALELLETPLLAVAPCDTPQLPRDLVKRLRLALERSPGAGVSYASHGGKRHYLCAVLRREALASLDAYLATGGRAAREWYGTIGAVELAFEGTNDSFLNINAISTEP
ncbi:MAG: molybdenum cofactor guanylyltransferase MobA [Pseudomonadota bacterium]